MTEKEFSTQIWRMYDTITLADGVKGKILGINFTTKSVRAFISGSPEWVRCELIDAHTTGKGGNADDTALIDELRAKVIRADERIKSLELEREKLQEKIEKNYLADLLRAVNIIKEGLTEKKAKIKKIDDGMVMVESIVERLKEQEGSDDMGIEYYEEKLK